jgi:predicted ATPase
MMPALVELTARNYRSLRDVVIPLSPLSVLVGPNNSGKSNVLDLIRFLNDSVRFDLTKALEMRGGYERVRFRGGDNPPPNVRIGVKANVTTHASLTALDEYGLSFRQLRRKDQRSVLLRQEQFRFKRYGGRGRRITIKGSRAHIVDEKPRSGETASERGVGLREGSLGLSTLPRLTDDEGGAEVRTMAELFEGFRVFDIDVAAARQPSRILGEALADDASNLAAFLYYLARADEDTWSQLELDAREIVPGLEAILFEPIGGASRAVSVVLREQGLRDGTSLADASYGTIRALALLACLYDPNPPRITCVEEIDHGLHPYSFDILVDRLREASDRTQFVVATHSPVLVNRLKPDELIVCERRTDGSSNIPAVDPADVTEAMEAGGGDIHLGELWFTGTLGGVPS